ncbi:MAG: hypothetical protein H3Z50_04390 [archaeon]|nr:hypothetical protein [archaeon]MCP8305666.1 hypothetical protein [archaeon]
MVRAKVLESSRGDRTYLSRLEQFTIEGIPVDDSPDRVAGAIISGNGAAALNATQRALIISWALLTKDIYRNNPQLGVDQTDSNYDRHTNSHTYKSDHEIINQALNT